MKLSFYFNYNFFTLGQRHKKANVNYTGTMIGNGKVIANNGKSNGGGNNATGNATGSQYIISPETDAKSDAMATHV